jgi:hypothetical protein
VTRARDNASNVAGDISGVTAGTGLTGGGSSGALTVSLDTPVSATNGGTAQSTFTTGDILYSSAANTLAKLNIGTTSQVLTVTNGLPTYANGSRATLTTTGDILYASAANTPARLGIGSSGQVLSVSAGGIPSWATVSSNPTVLGDTVATNQTTTSTSYTDLATVGPTVTMTTGTKVLVIIQGQIDNGAGTRLAWMSYAVSGATTVAATDDRSRLVYVGPISGGSTINASASVFYVTGLTVGSNTFTAKYKSQDGGSVSFANRSIIIMNLGS